MNFETMTILAQGAPGGAGGLMGNPMIFMLLLFAILYFMMIRPQQRKEKERKAMIQAIKTGDRVVFAGGLIGSVANVKESVFVIKIADNVKIDVARGAVTRVVDKGEAVGEEEDGR